MANGKWSRKAVATRFGIQIPRESLVPVPSFRKKGDLQEVRLFIRELCTCESINPILGIQHPSFAL